MIKEKVCVYTCITGDYDNLKEIQNIEQGIDYYCFTNNKKIKSNTWKVVYIKDDKLTNVQLARKIKILGHPIINDNYDIQLWMDGAVVFKKNITLFINTFMKKNDLFVAFRHGERDNIKDECENCIRLKKETKEKVKKLLEFYDNNHYPDKNGLIESTVYIKRNKNELVRKTMKIWFEMILNYSHRDQLSFNYCIYKTGLNVKWINEKVFDNSWFDWIKHSTYKKNINKYRVYFGDELKYDMNNDIQDEYEIENDTYKINIEIPEDCQKIVIELTDVPCIEFSDIKINGNVQKKFVYNYIELNNHRYFYNEKPMITIFGNFKKNDKFKFSIKMIPLNDREQKELIELLSINTIQLKDKNKKLKADVIAREEYIKDMYDVINSSIIIRLLMKIKKKILNKKL